MVWPARQWSRKVRKPRLHSQDPTVRKPQIPNWTLCSRDSALTSDFDDSLRTPWTRSITVRPIERIHDCVSLPCTLRKKFFKTWEVCIVNSGEITMYEKHRMICQDHVRHFYIHKLPPILNYAGGSWLGTRQVYAARISVRSNATSP